MGKLFGDILVTALALLATEFSDRLRHDSVATVAINKNAADDR
jgi:hypothetical protein